MSNVSTVNMAAIKDTSARPSTSVERLSEEFVLAAFPRLLGSDLDSPLHTSSWLNILDAGNARVAVVLCFGTACRAKRHAIENAKYSYQGTVFIYILFSFLQNS